MRLLLAALVAAFSFPALAGGPVVLKNQIVCETPEEVRAFFDKAMEMEGQGILQALVAANRDGIKCVIAQGLVTYEGEVDSFTFKPDHRELDVTVHEFGTPHGPRYGWTTGNGGEGA